MSQVKRQRAANWTQDEKSALLDLAKERIDVIEDKSCDGKFIKMKADAWNKIHDNFIAQFGQRDLNRLKEQWRRMKMSSKTNISKEKNCRKLTGGGPPPPKKDGPCEMDWAIKDLLPNEFVKDDNEFDDDGQTDFENEEANTNILDIENNIIFTIEDESDTIKDRIEEIIAEAEVMPLASDVDPYVKTVKLEKKENNNDNKFKQTIAEPAINDNLHKDHKKLKKSISARSMTPYETGLLALHEARMEQQMRFEEERHRAQLQLIEEELTYWRTKRMMAEKMQDNRNMEP